MKKIPTEQIPSKSKKYLKMCANILFPSLEWCLPASTKTKKNHDDGNSNN